MREPKYAVLALAVICAAGGAAAAYGQSTSGEERNGVRFVEVPLTVNRDEQAAAVIRSVDSEKRVIESTPINSAELARARGAGEIQATERSDTRILPEGSGNARAAVDERSPAGGQPEARTRAGTQPDLEIVRAGGEDRDRSKPQAVIRIDDVARSREHARYEAEKKRRAAGKPAPDVAEQAKARSEVNWSAPREQTTSAIPSEVGSRPRVSDSFSGPAVVELR